MAEQLVFELVVPCFNEAASIPELIRSAQQAAVAWGLTSAEFQLVLVDNGSDDDSGKILQKEKEGAFSDWFRVVALTQNQGYGGGILYGLLSTQAPWVGLTHADLQCPIDDTFRALQKCQKTSGSVLVRGIRQKRRLSDWWISRMYELTVGLLWGFWKYDLNAQPKVFSRNLIGSLGQAPRGITFDAFILFQAQKEKFEMGKIPVTLLQRPHGQSHWAQGLRKRIKTFLAVITELRKLKAC